MTAPYLPRPDARMVLACELKPRDTIKDVGRVNTIILTSQEVTILLDPIAAPPGMRLAPDHEVWVVQT